MAPTLTQSAPVGPSSSMVQLSCSPALSITEVSVEIDNNTDLILDRTPRRKTKIIESLESPIDTIHATISVKDSKTLSGQVNQISDDADPALPELIIPNNLIKPQLNKSILETETINDNNESGQTIDTQNKLISSVECAKTLKAKIDAYGVNGVIRNINESQDSNRPRAGNIVDRSNSSGTGTPGDINYVFGFLIVFLLIMIVIGLCIYFNLWTWSNDWRSRFNTTSTWMSK